MKEKSLFQTIIKPIIVLACICIVVGVLLGYTNSITAPIIEENDRKTAEAARMAVLPGSKSFEDCECDTEALGITGAYKETSGLGMVLTAANKGYGGDVIVTVGLDAQGKIVGIQANVSTETSGVGTKAGKEDYLNQYMGLSGNADSVDTISGATYSSTAVKTGVQSILKAYEALEGGK